MTVKFPVIKIFMFPSCLRRCPIFAEQVAADRADQAIDDAKEARAYEMWEDGEDG